MISNSIVDTEWLSENLDAGVALVDVRPPPFYMQAHLPGAVNLPMFLLTGAPGDLARRLGLAGITRETPVVAYDDGAGPSAAVLYRMLRHIGHPEVGVLDGGITRWRHEGLDWEYMPITPEPVEYLPHSILTDDVVDASELAATLGLPETAVVDVRSPAEYLGLQLTASRNGHVPGAINIDWENNLTKIDGAVRAFKPDPELQQLYTSAGITPDKRVIVYCEVGHRASGTYLVLKHLGYPNVATYLPGWQEWGNRTDTPVEER